MEKHFEPYGKIVSVRIRRNFAFIQYEYQEDASKALDATNMRSVVTPPNLNKFFVLGLER